ncbi:MAG: reverse transcriptase family protein [Polyangiaceae bacterium]
MKLRRITAEALAAEWVSTEWTAPGLLERATRVLDAIPAWLPLVAADLIAAWPRAAPHEGVIRRAVLAHARAALDVPRVIRPTSMTTAAPIPTVGDLARVLGLDVHQLDAFTMRRHRESNVRFYHYDYAWQPKRSGGHRLLEAPRPRLKEIQRRALARVLHALRVQDAAHGFVPGRSIVTFAAPHVGRAVVVRVDLADFFGSIGEPAVIRLLLGAGYPDRVARALARLTTSRPPDAVLRTAPRGTRVNHLRMPHLPQGAPTSPLLSNAIAARLDARVEGLAEAFGARYTRYADDLAFSGDARFEGGLGAFFTALEHVIRDEGFRVRTDKTRVLRAHARQALAGVVVNERVGLARRDLERLEAILFNATKTGLDAQNRERDPRFLERLRGRVAHAAFVDPEKAKRVLALWAAVEREPRPA